MKPHTLSQLSEKYWIGFKKGRITEWIKNGFIPSIPKNYQKGKTRILTSKQIGDLKLFDSLLWCGYSRKDASEILKVYKKPKIRKAINQIVKNKLLISLILRKE